MHYLGQLPDLPLPHTNGPHLRTRRKALAQIVLCQGCCCGQTERGLPGVPLAWLKPIWKSEKLNKVVQLTVSGCLGPCDLPNVCCVVTPTEQAWYGRLTTPEDYAVLLAWAQRCREAGAVVPLPAELEHLRFERWPGDEDAEPFTPIEQEPADIVLLTAADTEVLTWSAAVGHLPAGFASVRALNLDRLRDRRGLRRLSRRRVAGKPRRAAATARRPRLLARTTRSPAPAGEGARRGPALSAGRRPTRSGPAAVLDGAAADRRCCMALLRRRRRRQCGRDAAVPERYAARHRRSASKPPSNCCRRSASIIPDHAGVLDLDGWRQRFAQAGRPTVGHRLLSGSLG